MLEKVHVTFYDIRSCGYYADGSTPAFGSTTGLLQELKEWSKGKLLAETQIGQSADDGEVRRTYLMGVEELSGDFLLGLWNEIPSTKDNKVASMPANAIVGSASAVMNKIQQGSIPGYATYFWFLPGQRVFATIRINQLVTGQPALQRYLESFLSIASSHVVQNTDPRAGTAVSHEITVVGYAKSNKDPLRTDVAPRFRTALRSKPTETDAIVKRANTVSRIHRKTSLMLKQPDDRSGWQKALTYLGLTQPTKIPRSARVRAAMSVSLTSDQVKTLIMDWKNNGNASDWDDCGFQFRGSQEIHWLSKSMVKHELSLDVDWLTDAQIKMRELLSSLAARKSDVTSAL